MLRRGLLLLLSVIVCVAVLLRGKAEPAAAPSSYGVPSPPNVDALSAELDGFAKREALCEWKRIHWESDLKSAQARAEAESKPLLVVLLVGELGKTDTARC